MVRSGWRRDGGFQHFKSFQGVSRFKVGSLAFVARWEYVNVDPQPLWSVRLTYRRGRVNCQYVTTNGIDKVDLKKIEWLADHN